MKFGEPTIASMQYAIDRERGQQYTGVSKNRAIADRPSLPRIHAKKAAIVAVFQAITRVLLNQTTRLPDRTRAGRRSALSFHPTLDVELREESRH